MPLFRPIHISLVFGSVSSSQRPTPPTHSSQTPHSQYIPDFTTVYNYSLCMHWCPDTHFSIYRHEVSREAPLPPNVAYFKRCALTYNSSPTSTLNQLAAETCVGKPRRPSHGFARAQRGPTLGFLIHTLWEPGEQCVVRSTRGAVCLTRLRATRLWRPGRRCIARATGIDTLLRWSRKMMVVCPICFRWSFR